jgi:hypothetical protein
MELWLENMKIFYSQEKLVLSQTLIIDMNNNTTVWKGQTHTNP